MSQKTIELEITQMAAGGEGLATFEGKKIFIPWGIVGDQVKIEITEEKKDFSKGRIVEILKKSSDRIDPPCPYFFKCGGCQWQHIRYSSQLEFKNNLLKTALQRIGKIQNPILKAPIAASNDFNYRNRIRLQVSKKGEIGFFRFHSNEVVPVEKCLIADEKINAKIVDAKKLAQTLLEKNPTKQHEIEIRIENGKAILDEDPGVEPVFTQVNTIQNQALQKRILESFDFKGDEKVLELFAGEGNFTFSISRLVQSIMAVESNPASIASAEEKTKKGHFKNIQWMEASSYRALEQLLKRAISFDCALLDPPRKGAVETLEGLIKLKIPQIVYVSCDPSTLARDVQILEKGGYRHEFSQLIDMFPHTYHIESLTCLVL